MNSRLVKGTLLAIIVILLLIGAAGAGFVVGRVFQTSEGDSFFVLPSLGKERIFQQPDAGTPKNLEDLFAPFWQAWELVHQDFVDQPLDDQALMRGAIKGMLESLDEENTSYISPEELQLFNEYIEGQDYEGIGAWVDTNGDYLTIISPMVGSPAEKAGLKPGDVVIAIDGKDMTGIPGEAVRQKVLGPAGTQVTLTIQRAGTPEPFDVVITRGAIKSSNVIGRMLDEDIAYVQLVAFGDQKTTDDFHAMLERLLAENPKGLILDLRYNGGGLVDSAVAVSSEFISEGVVAYEVYGNGEKTSFEAQKGGIATEIPLVVLINEGSASSSELVAGAIQDLGRGKLVGVASYGKGSVQAFTSLMDEQGAVRITTAKWLTPNGRTIDGVGLTPDLVVQNTDEDLAEGIDAQLQKAIDLLLGVE